MTTPQFSRVAHSFTIENQIMTKENLIRRGRKRPVRFWIRYNLEKEKFQVTAARDAETGLKLARKSKPDLILLDIMLPENGRTLSFCARSDRKSTFRSSCFRPSAARWTGSSASSSERTTTSSSPSPPAAAGAHHRASSPAFDGRGRTARRRSPSSSGRSRSISSGTRSLLRKARVLSRLKEFAILKLLIEANGKVLSREQLLEMIWGHG